MDAVAGCNAAASLPPLLCAAVAAGDVATVAVLLGAEKRSRMRNPSDVHGGGGCNGTGGGAEEGFAEARVDNAIFDPNQPGFDGVPPLLLACAYIDGGDGGTPDSPSSVSRASRPSSWPSAWLPPSPSSSARKWQSSSAQCAGVRLELAAMLLEAGASARATLPETGHTAVHLAAQASILPFKHTPFLCTPLLLLMT